ncbi:hypothetical protein [Alloyangia pacifica]|uniref:hypothetical protein n=1 Tax=Alloyangia pacifica TaxID=311180 RepID=UPI0031E405B9
MPNADRDLIAYRQIATDLQEHLGSALADVSKISLCNPTVHGLEPLDTLGDAVTAMIQIVKEREIAAEERLLTLQATVVA